jgi:hypothetical protein
MPHPPKSFPIPFDATAVRAEAARKRIPLYRLAVMARTNPAALSRALNGRACPTDALRKRLAEILGVAL